MTNWEKYFGSPEKVAMCRIDKSYDVVDRCTRDDYLVSFGCVEVGCCANQKEFYEWLQQESD